MSPNGQPNGLAASAPAPVIDLSKFQNIETGSAAVGRNDPCPCGSNKKWKNCGLKNTEEHQANIAKK